jgi:hypothetical protein
MQDQLERYRRDLPATRDLIADKAHWTTGTLALAADGVACAPQSPAACAWCLIGAFMRVTGLRGFTKAEGVLIGLLRAVPVHVNDRDGHAAVLALLDRAIQTP